MNQYRVRIVLSDIHRGREYDVQASSHASAIKKAFGRSPRPEQQIVVSSRLTARNVAEVWAMPVRPIDNCPMPTRRNRESETA